MEKRLSLPISINLEQLRENLDYLVTSMSAYMCDCLVLCLSEQNHHTGLNLKVETEPSDAPNKPVFISITEFSEPKSLFVKK